MVVSSSFDPQFLISIPVISIPVFEENQERIEQLSKQEKIELKQNLAKTLKGLELEKTNPALEKLVDIATSPNKLRAAAQKTLLCYLDQLSVYWKVDLLNSLLEQFPSHPSIQFLGCSKVDYSIFKSLNSSLKDGEGLETYILDNLLFGNTSLSIESKGLIWEWHKTHDEYLEQITLERKVLEVFEDFKSIGIIRSSSDSIAGSTKIIKGELALRNLKSVLGVENLSTSQIAKGLQCLGEIKNKITLDKQGKYIPTLADFVLGQSEKIEVEQVLHQDSSQDKNSLYKPESEKNKSKECLKYTSPWCLIFKPGETTPCDLLLKLPKSIDPEKLEVLNQALVGAKAYVELREYTVDSPNYPDKEGGQHTFIRWTKGQSVEGLTSSTASFKQADLDLGSIYKALKGKILSVRGRNIYLLEKHKILQIVAKINHYGSFVIDKWKIADQCLFKNPKVVEIFEEVRKLGYEKWSKQTTYSHELKNNNLYLYDHKNIPFRLAIRKQLLRDRFSFQMVEPQGKEHINLNWLEPIIYNWLSELKVEIKVKMIPADENSNKLTSNQKNKIKSLAWKLNERFDRYKATFNPIWDKLDQQCVLFLKKAIDVNRERGCTDYKALVNLLGLPAKGQSYPPMEQIEKTFYKKTFQQSVPSQSMPAGEISR